MDRVRQHQPGVTASVPIGLAQAIIACWGKALQTSLPLWAVSDRTADTPVVIPMEQRFRPPQLDEFRRPDAPAAAARRP